MTDNGYFNQVADQWDGMRETFFRDAVRDHALAAAEVQSGQLAADIGAGTGFMTEALLGRGLRVIAVDRSKAMLGVLKRKFPEGAVVCRVGEGERLPVSDAGVDAVFANMYLHHAAHPPRAISEMSRILRPGGRLVITDLDHHTHTFLKEEHHDRWMGFHRPDVAAWLTDAGLADVRVTCAGEKCCARSADGGASADISIFLAMGLKV